MTSSFAKIRYHREVTAMGRRFFGSSGGLPGFGIAERRAKKRSGGPYVPSLTQRFRSVTMSFDIVGCWIRDFTVLTSRPSHPGEADVLSDTRTSRNSNSVTGVEISVTAPASSCSKCYRIEGSQVVAVDANYP